MAFAAAWFSFSDCGRCVLAEQLAEQLAAEPRRKRAERKRAWVAKEQKGWSLNSGIYVSQPFLLSCLRACSIGQKAADPRCRLVIPSKNGATAPRSVLCTHRDAWSRESCLFLLQPHSFALPTGCVRRPQCCDHCPVRSRIVHCETQHRWRICAAVLITLPFLQRLPRAACHRGRRRRRPCTRSTCCSHTPS